jgi:hypothetical protein
MAHAVASSAGLRKKQGQTDVQFAEEMRARGYKRVTRWVLDISNPKVLAEYKRQLEKLAKHQRKEGVPDFFPPDEDLPGWS